MQTSAQLSHASESEGWPRRVTVSFRFFLIFAFSDIQLSVSGRSANSEVLCQSNASLLQLILRQCALYASAAT